MHPPARTPDVQAHSGGGMVVVDVVVVTVLVVIVLVVTVLVVVDVAVVVSTLHSVSKCDEAAWLVPSGQGKQLRREVCVSTKSVFLPQAGWSAHTASVLVPSLYVRALHGVQPGPAAVLYSAVPSSMNDSACWQYSM